MTLTTAGVSEHAGMMRHPRGVAVASSRPTPTTTKGGAAAKADATIRGCLPLNEQKAFVRPLAMGRSTSFGRGSRNRPVVYLPFRAQPVPPRSATGAAAPFLSNDDGARQPGCSKWRDVELNSSTRCWTGTVPFATWADRASLKPGSQAIAAPTRKLRPIAGAHG